MDAESVAENLIADLKKELGILVYDVGLAGSLATGTYTGTPDIDIMITTDLPVLALHELMNLFPFGRTKMGSLDIWYLPDYKGYKVDLVVLKPDDERTNTLLHSKYYKERLSEKDKAEIKKLKVIMKGFNIYGAELGGITGIACTRLVEVTGSAEASLNYLFKQFINEHQNLFIDDPTDENRNLLASIDNNHKHKLFDRIMVYKAHKNDLVSGRISYFPITLDFIRGHYKHVIAITPAREENVDRQYQAIKKAVSNSMAKVSQDLKWWNPILNWEVYYDSNFNLGFNMWTQENIFKNNDKDKVNVQIQRIPIDVIDEKMLKQWIAEGKAYVDTDSIFISYKRFPPYTDMVGKFLEYLYGELAEYFPLWSKIE